MKNRIFPILLSIFFVSILSSPLSAQEELNWKKHKKLADKLFEATQYVDAAAHYEAAWKSQQKEEELIYKAGECYYLIKDFKKTIYALQHVKDDNKRFPLVGLKYARALKQDEQYDAAKEAFIYFINAYQDEDKGVISNIVANEIKGCDLGIALAENTEDATIQIQHLTENINSQATEFAPIPYSDDLLYYSSTMKGNQSNLFRSQRKNGDWKKAVVAEGLPDFTNKHFANGSFTPDAKRFYFTLCNNGDGLNSKCEIYVLKREKSRWSEPVKLRDYINIEDATTTTQPWVVHKNGQEIIYFTSDRTGGYGGMDIWYTTRAISSNDMDFTYPMNAGETINTIGDEISPFYDAKKNTLYFSSNGKITLGGWDIFQAKGALGQWEAALNMGKPINSAADEFYYVLKPSRKGGFFVSNRLYGREKISTQHEDIFEFNTEVKSNSLNALGQILDGETMLPLNNARISLYELVGTTKRLLSSKKVAQSNYRFQILPNKKLRLVAEKKGYLKNTFDFDSYNSDSTIDYTHMFSLNKRPVGSVVATPSEKIVQQTADLTEASTNNKTTKLKTTGVNKPSVRKTNHRQKSASGLKSNSEDSINAITYKVQVFAVNVHNVNHPRYRYVKSIGKVETEKIAQMDVTRVLITDLSNVQAAKKIRDQVVKDGFVDAFVVKYRDGRRIGRIR